MNTSKKSVSILNNYYSSSHLSNTIRNYAKVIRQQDPEDFKKMPVFEYATENSKRKKRIYMWGNALFGALGNANFLQPVRHKYALENMCKPWRLPFADLHKVSIKLCLFNEIYALPIYNQSVLI